MESRLRTLRVQPFALLSLISFLICAQAFSMPAHAASRWPARWPIKLQGKLVWEDSLSSECLVNGRLWSESEELKITCQIGSMKLKKRVQLLGFSHYVLQKAKCSASGSNSLDVQGAENCPAGIHSRHQYSGSFAVNNGYLTISRVGGKTRSSLFIEIPRAITEKGADQYCDFYEDIDRLTIPSPIEMSSAGRISGTSRKLTVVIAGYKENLKPTNQCGAAGDIELSVKLTGKLP